MRFVYVFAANGGLKFELLQYQYIGGRMKKSPRELTVSEVSIQLSSDIIEELKAETHDYEIIGQPRAVKALEIDRKSVV